MSVDKSPTSANRKSVPDKKKQSKDDGFDLNLTYITDRIIAMGSLTSGKGTVSRNNIDDVVRFLESRHNKKYMVFNLSSEKEYDSSKFGNRVARFPFDDHHCPKFDDLEPFCEALNGWLSEDPGNIAAFHCKGKGRIGLVICSYLLHSGYWNTANESLKFYEVSRAQSQQGVTVPSQRRWVKYYEEFMSLKKQGKAIPLSKNYRLQSIFVSESAPQFKSCTIFNNELNCTWTQGESTVKKANRDGVGGNIITPAKAVILNKDVKIEFDGVKKQRLFSFWFNTDFVKDGIIKIEKAEIDKVNKDTKVSDFFVEVLIEDEEKRESNSLPLKNAGKEIDSMSIEQVVVTALKLQDNVVIRNRGWNQEIYETCFTGQDAVKWLLTSNTLASLEACIEFGNLLIKEKIIYEVQRKDEKLHSSFVNGPYFYRFFDSPSNKT